MGWREALLTTVGPGLLGGVTFRDWMRLLREERFAIAPGCLPRAVSITFHSLQNSLWLRIERRRFGKKIEEAAIEPPLFVLGHWRSGTTHLHNLICADSRFAYPTTYEACFPHTFLSTESWNSRIAGMVVPARRPFDNMEIRLGSPQEDEFALGAATLLSPCMAWVLPESRERFEKYLTMRDVPEGELDRWRAAFRLFLKKVTVRNGGRPLALKSPPHTARIRLLLEMFPGARFIHIARHPHAVLQSSRHLFTVNFDWHRLQRRRLEDLDDWVIRQYREMYDAYFEERSLIPPGRLHEIRFEELERDPVGQLASAYVALGLPDFDVARPAVESYVKTLAGYRKNAFPEPDADLRERIAREWRPCFEAWGYAP